MRAIPLAIILALTLALLSPPAGPAHAQAAVNLVPQARSLTNEEIERNKAIDQAYQESLKKIPAQKPSADPWGSVRSSGSSQAAPAKPAPQKTTKTQSTVR